MSGQVYAKETKVFSALSKINRDRGSNLHSEIQFSYVGNYPRESFRSRIKSQYAHFTLIHFTTMLKRQI